MPKDVSLHSAFTIDSLITDTPSVALARGPGGGGGHGGGGQGGGGQGGGGGKPVTGDLYGDQYVLLRDLDPTDSGGNGEPVLDENGQPILIGTDGRLIYFVEGAEGDFEIAPEDLPYTQTVELERANVARAPDRVMEKSLTEALAKIDAATEISLDPAGRILCDGVAIDSPLENLALYKYLMTSGGDSSWPEVTDHWPDAFKALLGGNLLDPDWDPSSLLGAAFSKESPITLDAVLYENSVLGVNGVSTVNGETLIDYLGFATVGGETYTYDREARFKDIWIQWYEDTDGDPNTLELVTDTVFNAVFKGQQWADSYRDSAADLGGVNDFAQSADDSRAVINFMHEHYGAIEVPAPTSETLTLASSDTTPFAVVAEHDEAPTPVNGTNKPDTIDQGGGPQSIYSLNGDDKVSAGGGPDIIDGGNGDDTLSGDGGPDTINGGNGDDVITGGVGPDVLTGGRGHDTFVFLSGGDAPARGGDEAEAGSDHQPETITDFKVGVDQIDVSAFGTLIGFSQSGPAVNAIWAEQDGTDAVIRVDLNGNVDSEHPAEMSVILANVDAAFLSADDFLF